MNALTVLLTSLMGLFSVVGAVPDTVIETSIRNQVDQVETLAVRTDLATEHQLLRGKVDRLRIAARGLYPMADVRIDTLDLETDVIDVDMGELRQGDLVWEQPLQAAVHVVFTQEDIDRALRSPIVIDQLEDMAVGLFGGIVGGMSQASLTDVKIQFLGDERIQLGATLAQPQTGEELVVELTTQLNLLQGTQLQFIEPELMVNGDLFEPGLMSQVINGFSQAYTLNVLEQEGITARLLDLDITEDSMSLVSFVRLSSSDDAE